MIPSALDQRRDLLIGAAAAVMAVGLGFVLARNPVYALLLLAMLGVAVTALRFGLAAFTLPALALLPWMVILEGVAPALLGTLIASAAAAGLLASVMPLRFDNRLVPLGAIGFASLLIVHAVFATDSEQLVQAAKFMVFPAVCLAVSSVGARELMPALKVPLLGSCIAAMVAHLGIVMAGVGSSGSYYGTGEKLGLAADGPHALALLSTIVAGAGLTVERTWMQITFFALGAIPAALTGVRSALLSILVILIIYFFQSRSKWKALAVLAVLGAIALLSGAADVITARFARESGDFSSLSSAGSGRGVIWTVALEGWEAAGPLAWAFGAGLRTVVEFEVAALAMGFVGHSDFIEVIVQLGIVGFVSWVALWVGLLRAGLAAIVLLPILVFGIVNGTLEYVAALTLGLCLAAACAGRREPDEA